MQPQLVELRVRLALNLSGKDYHQHEEIQYLDIYEDDKGRYCELNQHRSAAHQASISKRRKCAEAPHCKSRSAAVCIAWLMITESLSVHDAFAEVKRVHPRADPNYGFMETLRGLKLYLNQN